MGTRRVGIGKGASPRGVHERGPRPERSALEMGESAAYVLKGIEDMLQTEVKYFSMVCKDGEKMYICLGKRALDFEHGRAGSGAGSFAGSGGTSGPITTA